jgi:hypothetical protein
MQRHGRKFEKKDTLLEKPKELDGWSRISRLPNGTDANEEPLFMKLTLAFGAKP